MYKHNIQILRQFKKKIKIEQVETKREKNGTYKR